jgi:hypothetical protein
MSGNIKNLVTQSAKYFVSVFQRKKEFVDLKAAP